MLHAREIDIDGVHESPPIYGIKIVRYDICTISSIIFY